MTVVAGVAITGTIGVGKIQGDDPYSLDLAFRNLTAIAPNFLAFGARYFIISGTLTSRRELEELRSALPSVRLDFTIVNDGRHVVAVAEALLGNLGWAGSA